LLKSKLLKIAIDSSILLPISHEEDRTYLKRGSATIFGLE
jgi:hypothetical protein